MSLLKRNMGTKYSSFSAYVDPPFHPDEYGESLTVSVFMHVPFPLHVAVLGVEDTKYFDATVFMDIVFQYIEGKNKK